MAVSLAMGRSLLDTLNLLLVQVGTGVYVVMMGHDFDHDQIDQPRYRA